MSLVHVASTQEFPRTTWRFEEHERHLLGPAPEQLEQDPSQATHVLVVASKNWFFTQVGRHLPVFEPVGTERTGRNGEHVEHWLELGPEQLAQSGWQGRQAPVAVKVPEGQVETQVPAEARRLLGHDRQKSADPAQVLQELEQATEG